MNEEELHVEATIGLGSMRRQLSKREDELPTITVMHLICGAMRDFADQADKGEYGAYAVKSLIQLWKDLKLGEVTGEKISELNAVVDRMYAMACDEVRRTE